MDQLIAFQLLLSASIITMEQLINLWKKKKKKQRRWWVRPVNLDRRRQSVYYNLFMFIKQHDHEEFFKFTRMSPDLFSTLCNLVSPFLVKSSIRKPLPTELKLALTLSFLAHGNAVRTQSWDFRIGRSTAYKLIPEVCEAIWNALQPLFLAPMTRERWEEVAGDFFTLWQFPNCLGAIDGKHIRIKAPPNSGSEYYNYKKFFSLVLMAACDAHYKFTWVDIGQYGSISDGGVWNNSHFGNNLENGAIDLPPPKKLPGSKTILHHAFVGDEAFPLKTYLFRPYSKSNVGDAERVFNYRLSRARRVIENSFGILAARWQILSRMLSFNPDNVTKIVKALVCLHNFLMSSKRSRDATTYCPPCFVDQEHPDHSIVDGEWRRNNTELLDITRFGTNNATRLSIGQRNELRDYFISPVGEEQAPWQYARAFKGLIDAIPDP